ncbi:MAG: four-carbon acid sugar kinase family protein [Clostridia bacterium]|nr:four-carbon acid sugar kinase family protein [Clostridia bacterium]
MSTAKRRIGVAADDITGANDVGVMFSKNGYRVKVMSLSAKPASADFDETDVLVINTSCRLCSAQEARRLTLEAVSFLKQMRCRLLYIKTCSVFRGNIGAMFDAAQDALCQSATAVIAAYPANGRTTERGVHLLNGVPVANTHFANDPVTPLKYSNLAELIGVQSPRRCECFTYDMYGENEKKQLEALKQNAAYVIFDARDQQELRHAARLIADETLICGSSAVCEELPGVWGEADAALKYYPKHETGRGAVVLSGSLTPQTALQVQYLIKHGIYAERLLSDRLFSESSRLAETQRVFEACRAYTERGEAALVYTSPDRDGESAERRAAGLSDIDAGRCVSLAFRTLAEKFSREAGAERFVVAGGETSDAVSLGLGLREMRIYQEIEPGVPLMSAPGPRGEEYALVFKSGSFGSPEFLQHALDAVCGRDENS